MKIRYAILLLCSFTPLYLLAQCYPDRHNTSWTDAWVSCEPRQNPNPDRGLSHWILYDLGEEYPLGKMHLWNLNIPGEVESGIKTVEVEYLADENSSEWQQLGSFEVDKGPGTSIYEGEDVTDWDGIQTRYILLTFSENYGGPCTGFSEVKIDLKDVEIMTEKSPETHSELTVRTYPNPFKNRFTLSIYSESEDPIHYRLVNVLGQVIREESISFQGAENIQINTAKLPAGNYYIFVEQAESRISKSLIHIP